MSTKRAPRSKHRHPCPCRPCRQARGASINLAGMQQRKTIQRHIEAQAAKDLQEGRLPSEEEHAKIMALLHGAGVRFVYPRAPPPTEAITGTQDHSMRDSTAPPPGNSLHESVAPGPEVFGSALGDAQQDTGDRISVAESGSGTPERMAVDGDLGLDNHRNSVSESEEQPPEDCDDEEDIELDARDPLAAHIDDLFPDKVASDPSSYANGQLPPAFSEDSLIRRAYIQAFIASAFHGATNELVHHILTSERGNLASLCHRIGYDLPGLATMAVTLRTVERRLGVDPDQHIIYYFVCDNCWSRHHPSVLSELEHSRCLQPGCTGRLYDVKTLSDGQRRRRPLKPLPTVSLRQEIQRILLRPGKPSELDAWRESEDDAQGEKEPVAQEDWPGFHDPDFRLYDMWDGWGWNAIQAGLARRRGGRWEVEDVDVGEMHQRFVALPMGLVVIFNIDWFRGFKRGKYSVGAIYATICNNPRAKRFLLEETILLAIIPGPEEPSLEQLNAVLEPFVADARHMYQVCNSRSYYYRFIYPGVPMQLAGADLDDPSQVNMYLNILAADLPGSRKTTGLRGHTSKAFMCSVCKKPLHSLTSHECYDAATFEYREDGRYLKYAFRARDADEATRTEIAERRGVRWSVLNLLPDWFPARDGPPDFMHAAYLGEAKHVLQDILVGGGMFTKRSSKDKPLEKLEEFFDTVWWPGSAGRVPRGILSGSGKADQFRNMCAVLPVALYASWQIDGEIPDRDAPRPQAREKAGRNLERVEGLVNERRHAEAINTGNTAAEQLEHIDHTRMNRNYQEHYSTVLVWLVSLRIFGSRSISVQEAHRAADCHSWACQAWARMLCHLTPYFHILSHIVIWILRLGPVYGWWTYPYERFNGFLSKVRHNGHPGELEATMMRAWVKYQLIYDLILHLENLGDEQTEDDRQSIISLRNCLESHRRSGNERGTLLTMLAAMSADHDASLIRYPRHSRKFNLRREGLYALVFSSLRRLWAGDIDLITDTSTRDVGGSPFVGAAVPAYPYVVVAGVRYGASTAHRGRNFQYAYINGRDAVQIDHIFQISHSPAPGQMLVANIAVVRPFIPSSHEAEMPWAARATDLGIGTWSYSRLGSPMVVDVKQFSGHFALASVPLRSKRLWDSQEPDIIDDDEHAQESDF
ncbi:hypothetical protein LXA43DRAFT_1130213 [Ganoderma leucocontextum]|nr:hypothetical protein LXA43DRAFT_1130213 [Ganoderma leucocontextum]